MRPSLLLSIRRRRLLPPSDRGLRPTDRGLRPTDRGLRPRSLREPLRRLLRDPDLRIFLRPEGVLLRDSSLALGVVIRSCSVSAAAAASASADTGIGGLLFSKLSRALQ